MTAKQLIEQLQKFPENALCVKTITVRGGRGEENTQEQKFIQFARFNEKNKLGTYGSHDPEQPPVVEIN